MSTDCYAATHEFVHISGKEAVVQTNGLSAAQQEQLIYNHITALINDQIAQGQAGQAAAAAAQGQNGIVQAHGITQGQAAAVEGQQGINAQTGLWFKYYLDANGQMVQTGQGQGQQSHMGISGQQGHAGHQGHVGGQGQHGQATGLHGQQQVSSSGQAGYDLTFGQGQNFIGQGQFQGYNGQGRYVVDGVINAGDPKQGPDVIAQENLVQHQLITRNKRMSFFLQCLLARVMHR